MKKLLVLLLALSAMLILFSASLAEEKEPETFASGDWACTVQDDGTVVIDYYFGNDTIVEIPDQLNGRPVSSIGSGAFLRSSSLITVMIPDSVTDIGDSAFTSCSSLTTVMISDSVTSISANPFYRCEKLKQIIVSPDHPYLATIDGVLFNKPDRRLVCYPGSYESETYEIPQGIREIGDCAFTYCKSLTTVTIPDSVTSIGNSAFHGCSSLTTITIPDSVTSIGGSAFYNCKALTTITIPDSVTSIGDSAFSYCEALTTITIPDSVTSIGEAAFKGCESLTVTVPRNSYAKQYCEENNIKYTYPDANDWLND